MSTLSLTQAEASIILHRLDAGGAVADALSDAENAKWTYEQVDHAVLNLSRRLLDSARTIELTPDTLELEVLVDAVEGSTFFAGIDDAVALKERSKAEVTALRRSATHLETKLSALVGRPVAFPA